MTELRFTVFGVAQPKGSTRAFAKIGANRTTGLPQAFAVTTSDNPRLADWQLVVATQANVELHKQRFVILTGRVFLEVHFFLPRPRSLKAKIVPHTKRPDLDKLIRAVKDALSQVVWQDDAQVTQVTASKQYALPSEAPYVQIAVQGDD